MNPRDEVIAYVANTFRNQALQAVKDFEDYRERDLVLDGLCTTVHALSINLAERYPNFDRSQFMTACGFGIGSRIWLLGQGSECPCSSCSDGRFLLWQ